MDIELINFHYKILKKNSWDYNNNNDNNDDEMIIMMMNVKEKKKRGKQVLFDSLKYLTWNIDI